MGCLMEGINNTTIAPLEDTNYGLLIQRGQGLNGGSLNTGLTLQIKRIPLMICLYCKANERCVYIDINMTDLIYE